MTPSAAERRIRAGHPGIWHVWQLFLSLPQAVESLDNIARFLKSHLRFYLEAGKAKAIEVGS